MVSDQSYFAQFVEPSPLRHTWSLAIEEQFYLLFPLLLVAWLGRARLGLRALRLFLLAAAFASAGLMAALHDPLVDPSRSYYGTDTRMQALLLGAVLALSPGLTRPSTPLYTRVHGRLLRLPGAGLVGGLAAAGLLVMFVRARELAPGMYNGGFLVAAAVVGGHHRRSVPGPAFFPRPDPVVAAHGRGGSRLIWLVPVALARLRRPHRGTHRVGRARSCWGCASLVTGTFAALSYRLVEQPIHTQRLQRRLTPTQWTRMVTAATAHWSWLLWARQRRSSRWGWTRPRQHRTRETSRCRMRTAGSSTRSSSVTRSPTVSGVTTAIGLTGWRWTGARSWAAGRCWRSVMWTGRPSRTSRPVPSGRLDGRRR